MTLPGMWGVERFGRRRLLLVGAAGMCICEFIIAIVGVTVSVQNLAGQKVLIAFVCIYIVCVSIHITTYEYERPCLPLGLLCLDMGSNCLGHHWRDISTPGSGKGYVSLRCQ